MAEYGVQFTNSDEVMEKLTNVIGFICKKVTNYNVVEADENIVPKVDGPFILVDLAALDQFDWQTNEVVIDGKFHAVHNYTATYTLTAYRGNPHLALARVLQAFKLPYIYDTFFPTGSPFAYSSASTIARMRVPLNQQFYEKRARVQIIFNIAFTEGDFGVFETVDKILIDFKMDYVDQTIELPIEVG